MGLSFPACGRTSGKKKKPPKNKNKKEERLTCPTPTTRVARPTPTNGSLTRVRPASLALSPMNASMIARTSLSNKLHAPCSRSRWRGGEGNTAPSLAPCKNKNACNTVPIRVRDVVSTYEVDHGQQSHSVGKNERQGKEGTKGKVSIGRSKAKVKEYVSRSRFTHTLRCSTPDETSRGA